ncbi:ABC-type amino acid transport substrate-binding protein [Pelomonas saccharophila]|uniref:ABC-type amino acid transport substrate-binding protein n=1 Tax=Roseateles saccharophilus TaxID=304 RepID=A0ABU1YU55_ROSSA|nr:transporter substrate-binding domain-containing protein [Roseateles saccharophilus]MDR7272395.1 ABC-type amino acid transport substrate-binding protein [Roseateles saccharophilus]
MTSKHEPGRRQALALALATVVLPARAAPLVPLFVGTGPPSDQTPQMLAWLATQAGLGWDYRPTPWLRAQKLTAAGEGVMYGLSRTPRREKELLFSLPIWTNHTWAVVRRGEEASIRRYGDLDGQAVCWARGSSYGELFSQAGLGRMKALEANDDDTALRMAAAGRCRAALITLETGDATLAARHPALAGMQGRGLVLVPVAMTTTSLHFATGLNSHWTWVIDRIDRVVARSRTELDRLRLSAAE